MSSAQKALVTVSPDSSKLGTVFDACKKRLDETANLLLQAEKYILAGTVQIKYHSNCRSTYVSQWHILHTSQGSDLKRDSACSSTNSGDGGTACETWECSRFTRSQSNDQQFG